MKAADWSVLCALAIFLVPGTQAAAHAQLGDLRQHDTGQSSENDDLSQASELYRVGDLMGAAEIYLSIYQENQEDPHATESLVRLSEILNELGREVQTCKVIEELEEVYSSASLSSFRSRIDSERQQAGCAYLNLNPSSSWTAIQAGIKAFNHHYKLTYHDEFLDHQVKGSISVTRNDDGDCQFEFARKSDSFTSDDGSHLVGTSSLARFEIVEGEELHLINLPFQNAAEEPLPADFKRNLAIAVVGHGGAPRVITSERTNMKGRELLDDPADRIFYLFDPSITPEVDGKIRTLAVRKILKSAAPLCGITVKEVKL
ncbi:tetratricopeptide repeat protein [Sphingomicrobium astaxanthinifaciens]|uniref:tetratricopeptide repeat protein n=1 Tax=Sphingomicrobium astaxanthinifaciens TaxID=1227949 RepID=UPI001FCAC7B0|nr:hypothetical protein [Sphingomicrobium astaxanthinifaciens]MCJ7420441.1 hypothetical protein [Sphingomicrobium astaxanthinifaciens]